MFKTNLVVLVFVFSISSCQGLDDEDREGPYSLMTRASSPSNSQTHVILNVNSILEFISSLKKNQDDLFHKIERLARSVEFTDSSRTEMLDVDRKLDILEQRIRSIELSIPPKNGQRRERRMNNDPVVVTPPPKPEVESSESQSAPHHDFSTRIKSSSPKKVMINPPPVFQVDQPFTPPPLYPNILERLRSSTTTIGGSGGSSSRRGGGGEGYGSGNIIRSSSGSGSNSLFNLAVDDDDDDEEEHRVIHDHDRGTLGSNSRISPPTTTEMTPPVMETDFHERHQGFNNRINEIPRLPRERLPRGEEEGEVGGGGTGGTGSGGNELKYLMNKIRELEESLENVKQERQSSQSSYQYHHHTQADPDELLQLKEKQSELQRTMDSVLIHFSSIFKDMEKLEEKVEKNTGNNCNCQDKGEDETHDENHYNYGTRTTTPSPTRGGIDIRADIDIDKIQKGFDPYTIIPPRISKTTTTTTTSRPFSIPRQDDDDDGFKIDWDFGGESSSTITTTEGTTTTTSTTTPPPVPVHNADYERTSQEVEDEYDPYGYFKSYGRDRDDPYGEGGDRSSSYGSSSSSSYDSNHQNSMESGSSFDDSNLDLMGSYAFLKSPQRNNKPPRMRRDLGLGLRRLHNLTREVKLQKRLLDKIKDEINRVDVSQALLVHRLLDERTISPKDCSELMLLERNEIHKDHKKASNGSFIIFPDQNQKEPVKVSCDFQTSGGGWTIIQRRSTGNLNFFRNWSDYEQGFGTPEEDGECWIGLKNMAILTKKSKDDDDKDLSSSYELRIDMEKWDGQKGFASYKNFRVEDALSFYKLRVAGYSGSGGGDSLKRHDGMAFSTYDQDHDEDPHRNCAEMWKGAWWYYACHESNLNGLYFKPQEVDGFGTGIVWQSFTGNYESLKRVEMKIRNKKLVIR